MQDIRAANGGAGGASTSPLAVSAKISFELVPGGQNVKLPARLV